MDVTASSPHFKMFNAMSVQSQTLQTQASIPNANVFDKKTKKKNKFEGWRCLGIMHSTMTANAKDSIRAHNTSYQLSSTAVEG